MARFLVLVCVSAWLSGCGLHFVGPGAQALPSAWQSIAVPVLDNRTADPRLGLSCTRALQNRLSAGGRVVGPNPEEADLVLRGAIDSLQEQPLAFEAEGVRTRIESEITVEVTLVATEGGEEVWRSEGLTGWRVYTASGQPSDVETARRAAARMACEDAILSGVDALVDDLWTQTEATARRQPD